MGFNIVVVENDPSVAKSLKSCFHSVQLSRSGEELRQRVAKNKPDAVILDMEHSRLSDVKDLRRDFHSLPIVCTHRIADEELWVAALDAGASDVCRTDEVQTVLSSVLRNSARKPVVA